MNATSLADLWVQAAINVDNEEVFETDSDSGHSDREEGTSTSNQPAASTSLGSAAAAVGRHRPSMASNSSRPTAGMRRLGLQTLTPARRPSNGSLVPAIFSHTGVRTPPNIAPLATPGRQTPDLVADNTGLPTIVESRPISTVVAPEEKPPSTWSMLPMMIILQYGLLALHSTTHDQIFYLYLVS
jgi:hypothetical protein